LRLWVEPQKQSGLKKFGIVAGEGFPSAAVATFTDVLLNQGGVSHCDGFVVSIRLSQGRSVVADRAAEFR
jgi:hypothetical protein